MECAVAYDGKPKMIWNFICPNEQKKKTSPRPFHKQKFLAVPLVDVGVKHH